MAKKQNISIIEIDSRDARYQSGIATYFNILRDGMPSNISTYNIVFYLSPDFKDVKVVDTGDELQIFHPKRIPGPTLFEAVFAYIAPKLQMMPNLIVKSNCLSCEGLAYLIKSRVYCKTIGVLHCQPKTNIQMGLNRTNPFFNMDHIILVGDNGKQYLEYWHNTRPYSVIYNGVDKPTVTNKKPQDGVFRFVFPNGWAPRKGFDKIIPAIRMVAKKHKIEVVVLGGHAREAEGLFEEVSDLPIVRMGLVNDVAEIRKCYEQADAALFASRSEACSFAGLEAMAYGLPIVSTNESAMVEMFDDAALFVDMAEDGRIDASQYAAAMTRLIEDKSLRTRLGARAQSRCMSRYKRKKMVADTVAVYEELITE